MMKPSCLIVSPFFEISECVGNTQAMTEVPTSKSALKLRFTIDMTQFDSRCVTLLGGTSKSSYGFLKKKTFK